MPAFAGKTFSDPGLLSGIRKGLFERSSHLSPEETLAAIQDLKQWVGEELAFEEAASASFGRILSELWHTEYLDQLPPLLNKFERLVSAYFVRRGSVTAFHGFCTAWRDGLLKRILLFAEEGLEVSDQVHPPAPYALLAAGSLGRGEQSLEESERYFLIWREGEAGYFEQFAYRVLAILDQFGLVGKEPGAVAKVLWRGSLQEWERYTSAGGDQEGEPELWQYLADLRTVSGDEGVGKKANRIARRQLENCRIDVQLAKVAQECIVLPVALGMFGGIRVERGGEYAGCFNVQQYGLHPLISAARLLAVQHDLDPGPTLDRLAALRALGVLEEELAKRLEDAYHQLATLRIGKQIALEQPYIKPGSLSSVEQQKLKASLESVRQLQRTLRRALLLSSRTKPR